MYSNVKMAIGIDVGSEKGVKFAHFNVSVVHTVLTYLVYLLLLNTHFQGSGKWDIPYGT